MPDDSNEDIGDDGAPEPESNEDGLIVENGDRESVATANLLVSQNPLKLFELHCNGKAKGKAECGVLIEYLQSIFGCHLVSQSITDTLQLVLAFVIFRRM
jgi:hypothetical protein